MKTKVYIAGPYTSDPRRNTRKAIEMAERLMGAGYTPFVPHLNYFWNAIYPKEYKEWMDYDEQWIMVCDIMIRLPGESKGADKEEKLFWSLGRPVFRDLEKLIKTIPSET